MAWNYEVKDGKSTILKGPGKGAIAIPAVLGGHPVAAIGADAFLERSGLKSVTIPNSVTDIGWDAFKNCDKLNSATRKWLNARWPDSVDD